MNYFRSLFLNFLVVFFVDRVAPGIEVDSFEKVPNIGADLLFSFVVGLLNASVFPFLAILELNPTRLKMAVGTFAITALGLMTISIFPLGVRVVSVAGGVIGGAIIWGVAYLTNYWEWKTDVK